MKNHTIDNQHTKPPKSSLGTMSRVFIYVIIATFAATSLPLTSLLSQTTKAATQEQVDAFDSGITKALYKYSLATCVGYSPLRDDAGLTSPRSNINEEHAVSLQLFADTGNGFGVQPLDIFAGYWLKATGSQAVNDYGAVSCSNPKFIEEAGLALGYAATIGDTGGIFGMLCDMGFRRSGGDGCSTGTGSWDRRNGGAGDAFRDNFLSKDKPRAIPDLTPAQNYKLLYNTLMYQCDITLSDIGTSNLTQGVAKLKVWDNTKKEMVDKYAKWGSNKKSFSATVTPGDIYTPGIGATVNNPRNTTNFPAGTVSAGGPIQGSVRLQRTINGCEAFIALTNEYADDFWEWNNINKDGDADPATSTNTNGSSDNQSSCNIKDIGWLLCPVLRVGANLADSAYGFLASNFLEVKAELFTNNSTRDAWNMIRNIANIAFVIVFMFVIFSQLSSVGVTNYGVKKLLPRLIIGVILVNISFFVCQLAIDISNIVGYGFNNMLSSIAAGIPNGGMSNYNAAGQTLADESGHLGGILVGVIAGAAGAAIIWINLGAVALAIIAGLITLLTVFVLLVARETFIILLVVASPLAIVAYLLPNTEKFFKYWLKMFGGLLLVFPIIGLLYGTAQLASAILLSTGRAVNGGTGDTVLQVTAYLALVIPLLAIWPLLQGSMKAIPVVGNAIQNMGKRGSNLAQSGAKGTVRGYKNSNYGKFRAARKADRDARIRTGEYEGLGGNFNLRNWRSRANKRRNESQVFNAVTGGYGAELGLSAEAQSRKDMSEVMAMFGNDDTLAQAWAESKGNNKSAEYGRLSKEQKEAFDKMYAAGHHRKPASFLAAAQYLSENGKGEASSIKSALDAAESAGADKLTVSRAKESAKVAYRKSGRGDALAALDGRSAQSGWAEVSQASVNRKGLTTPQQQAEYEDFLRRGATDAQGNYKPGVTATKEALRAYSQMDARTQNAVHDIILSAASEHAGGRKFSDPDEAKTYFDIK